MKYLNTKHSVVEKRKEFKRRLDYYKYHRPFQVSIRDANFKLKLWWKYRSLRKEYTKVWLETELLFNEFPPRFKQKTNHMSNKTLKLIYEKLNRLDDIIGECDKLFKQFVHF